MDEPGLPVSYHEHESYRRSISAAIARMEVKPQCRHEFGCTMAEQRIGPLQVLKIRSDAVLLRRSRRCISDDRRVQYIVGLSLTGRCSVEHESGGVDVPENSFFLLDKALPYETTFHEAAERVLVCVDRSSLDRRLRDPGRYLRATSSAASGAGSLAAGYLTSLLREAGRLNANEQAQAAETCLDLLAMALGGAEVSQEGVSRSAGRLMLMSRMKAFARGRLSDPDLGPIMIAEAHDISKRYLHALFAETGTTLGAWIRSERLERARARLEDPRLSHLSVTQIALDAGFNDIPHFSRQFKARFGAVPTSLRVRPAKPRPAS